MLAEIISHKWAASGLSVSVSDIILHFTDILMAYVQKYFSNLYSLIICWNFTDICRKTVYNDVIPTGPTQHTNLNFHTYTIKQVNIEYCCVVSSKNNFLQHQFVLEISTPLHPLQCREFWLFGIGGVVRQRRSLSNDSAILTDNLAFANDVNGWCCGTFHSPDIN